MIAPWRDGSSTRKVQKAGLAGLGRDRQSHPCLIDMRQPKNRTVI